MFKRLRLINKLVLVKRGKQNNKKKM